MNSKKIALIGMMGCGKTSVSKLLSEKMNLPLYDLDDLFCKKYNIEISDFFKKFGEEDFRKKETELLKEISNKKEFILSTGGGIVLKEENQKILFNADILTIYLKVNSDEIYERIKDDKSRPLLLVENPKSEIEKILNKRENLYNKAKLIIENKNSIKETVEEIIKNAKFNN